MTDPKPTLGEVIGAELRSVVTQLESAASHVTTCRKALESQNLMTIETSPLCCAPA